MIKCQFLFCGFKDKQDRQALLCCPLSVYFALLVLTISACYLFPPKSIPSPSCVASPPSVVSPSHVLGGSGGDSAWRGERSDVQGVPAVGVCGQSPDAAGSAVGSP